jgi:hypothetical protein
LPPANVNDAAASVADRADGDASLFPDWSTDTDQLRRPGTYFPLLSKRHPTECAS